MGDAHEIDVNVRLAALESQQIANMVYDLALEKLSELKDHPEPYKLVFDQMLLTEEKCDDITQKLQMLLLEKKPWRNMYFTSVMPARIAANEENWVVEVMFIPLRVRAGNV